MDLLISVLTTFLRIMMFAIIGRALISWVDPRGSNPISRFLTELTEPIVAPIRSVMPRTGMIDLSPLVAILLLRLLMQMLFRVSTG